MFSREAKIDFKREKERQRESVSREMFDLFNTRGGEKCITMRHRVIVLTIEHVRISQRAMMPISDLKFEASKIEI